MRGMAGASRRASRSAANENEARMTDPAAWARRTARTTGAGGLSLAHHAVRSAAFVRFFQVRGFSVWCWTVNDRAAIRRLAACGVDAILSDNPALLKRVLA